MKGTADASSKLEPFQHQLKVTLNISAERTELTWLRLGEPGVAARCFISGSGPNQLTWQLTLGSGEKTTWFSTHHPSAIRAKLAKLRELFPTRDEDVQYEKISREPRSGR